MNPVLAFLVLIGAIAVWFALVKLSDYIDDKLQKKHKEKDNNE